MQIVGSEGDSGPKIGHWAEMVQGVAPLASDGTHSCKTATCSLRAKAVGLGSYEWATVERPHGEMAEVYTGKFLPWLHV